MNSERDSVFTDRVKQVLDRHADGVDEVTAARLRVMRRSAVSGPARSRINRLPFGGLAMAAAVLAAVLVWNYLPRVSDGVPGDEEMLSQMENLELLEDLDFYAWLEATQSSS
ncbi:MAG TPA: hypothetical protein ENK49_11405 [Gammaproteobacteria bacterium]|nr:hypothetical protein [Gammaproteobacteria bacterium]